MLNANTLAQFNSALHATNATELAAGVAYQWRGDYGQHHLDKLRQLIANRPIDIALIPAQNAKKMLLIADMDSTMIQQECIDELAQALGLRDKIAKITERAMNGELDFRAALDERVGLLEGLTTEQMTHVRDTAIHLTSGAQTLMKTLHANGVYKALVSGGFTFFAEKIANELLFDECTANILLLKNDKLTGKVADPISDKHTKKQRLIAIAADLKLNLDQTMAVGDGANDLDMLTTAGLGVAFHAKPAVAAKADVRIDHSDLTSLLYIQGYKEGEFIR